MFVESSGEIFSCFFCGKDYTGRQKLQKHQQRCNLRLENLQIIRKCSETTPKRLWQNQGDKNNFFESLQLIPNSSNDRLGLGYRILRSTSNSEVSEVIMIDDDDEDIADNDKDDRDSDENCSTVQSSPRFEKSLIAFHRQHSTSKSSRLISRQCSVQYRAFHLNCMSPELKFKFSPSNKKAASKLLNIPICSPLGQRLHKNVSFTTKYFERTASLLRNETYCKTLSRSTPNSDFDSLRICENSDKFQRTKTGSQRYCHTYRNSRKTAKRFWKLFEIDLNTKRKRMKQLISCLKNCSVSLTKYDNGCLQKYLASMALKLYDCSSTRGAQQNQIVEPVDLRCRNFYEASGQTDKAYHTLDNSVVIPLSTVSLGYTVSSKFNSPGNKSELTELHSQLETTVAECRASCTQPVQKHGTDLSCLYNGSDTFNFVITNITSGDQSTNQYASDKVSKTMDRQNAADTCRVICNKSKDIDDDVILVDSDDESASSLPRFKSHSVLLEGKNFTESFPSKEPFAVSNRRDPQLLFNCRLCDTSLEYTPGSSAAIAKHYSRIHSISNISVIENRGENNEIILNIVQIDQDAKQAGGEPRINEKLDSPSSSRNNSSVVPTCKFVTSRFSSHRVPTGKTELAQVSKAGNALDRAREQLQFELLRNTSYRSKLSATNSNSLSVCPSRNKSGFRGLTSSSGLPSVFSRRVSESSLSGSIPNAVALSKRAMRISRQLINNSSRTENCSSKSQKLSCDVIVID